MIFRNTFRLLITNFSNVWKSLLYYVICILLSLLVCTVIAMPIINKLNEANVFNDFFAILNNFFSSKPQTTAYSIDQVNETFWNVLTQNSQFIPNYVFLSFWIIFMFPFLLNLALVPNAEVLYGYMTSHVKYSWTVKYIKYIGKSLLYSLARFIVLLPLNVLIISLIYSIIKIATLGVFLYYLLDILLLGVLLCVVALKYSLFACWLPAIAVFNHNAFYALKTNFKCVFKKFFSIFSTCILLVIIAFVVNLIFAVFSFTLSLIITLPLTAFTFVVFNMVSFFTCQGMRFYVYPDTVVSPKTFEETDSIKKIKYVL